MRWMAVLGMALVSAGAGAQELPVKSEILETDFEEVPYYAIANLLWVDALHSAVSDGEDGLTVDFRHISRLLDGTDIDPADIYGTAYSGPYPFEAQETEFPYERFRSRNAIREGGGRIDAARFFHDVYNANDWETGGRLALRFDLWLEQDGPDRHLGIYQIYVNFRREGDQYSRLPSLVEGPFVSMVHSGEPSKALISFRTDQPAAAAVHLKGGEVFQESDPSREHVIEVTGLRPDSTYVYWVSFAGVSSHPATLRTAPLRGEGPVRLAYTGDSREGVGGGMQNYMGANFLTLNRLANLAFLKGADVFLMGGDLINGYTTSRQDFLAQFYAWKQAMSGFWLHRPVYPAMGNHEALLRVYRNENALVRVDRWPYDSHSAEAAFARSFYNPSNGPTPSDPRRPSYDENVYSFQYGPVLAIAYNNNYWASNAPAQVGGSPEGFIFDDQLNWIEGELKRAEGDPTIRYVVLFAQEPVFPNGGHVGDGMWYGGNNTIRAYAYRDGRLVPEEKGIVEVRNAFAKMIAASSKVAAVFGSDEHAYHRCRIGKDVPIGVMAQDDANGDGIIGEGEAISALPALQHDTWYIVSGGAGAPYYSEQDTPWNLYWKGKRSSDEDRSNYFYSSQENLLLLHADDSGISLEVYTPYGELLDHVDNLMEIK